MKRKINILLILLIFLYSKLLLPVPFERETMVKEFEKLEHWEFSKTENRKSYDEYMYFLSGEWRISKNLSRSRITLEDRRKVLGKYIRVENNKIYFPAEFDTFAYSPRANKINLNGSEIKKINITKDYLYMKRMFEGIKESPENYGFEYDKNIAIAEIEFENGSLDIIHINPNRIMIFGSFLLLIKETHPMFKEFNQFEHIKVSKGLNKNDYDKYMTYLRGKWRITNNINDSIDHRKNPPTNVEKYNGSFVIIKGDRILFPDSFFINNYFDEEFSRIQKKKKKKRGYKIDYVACIVGRTYEFFSDGGPNYDPSVAGLEDDVEVAEAQIKYIGDDYFHTTFFHLSPTKMKMGIGTRYFTLEKVE